MNATNMTPLVALISEVFAGTGFVLSIVFAGILNLRGVPISSTIMLLVGISAGSFFSLKGASGTNAVVSTIANVMSNNK